MVETIIYTSIAGIIGTSLGGLIGIFFGRTSEKITSFLLSIAGGIMLSITFFDLIPESLEMGGIWVTTLGVIWAIIILYFIDYIISQKHKKLGTKTKAQALALILKENNPQKRNSHLFKTGMVMFLAIALHDLPEGLAIGTLNLVENQMAITLTILIALHNIPEGMAISVPLVASGAKKRTAFLLSFISGSATVLGGFLGIVLGNINEAFTSFSLALAGGAMLYVTIMELVPEMLELDKSKAPKLLFVLGILLGLVLIYII